jgi:uncharacterized protein YgiM (DUF1202 family)
VNSKRNIIILFILLFTTGCGAKIQKESTATPTLLFVTATFIPSLTPTPGSPLPPPPTPTTVPVEGTASTQINVRAQPSTSGEVLGIIAANAKIQIIGKDPGGNWWQIMYPASPDEKGWVTAQYVTTAGTPDVPVIGGSGTNQNNGNVAIIQQKLNVRSGPGTDFNSLGTLNPQDVVNLIGKDSNGAWLQVEFMAGPDGKGWINAAFAQAKGVENLPIIAESGLIVGTGTPTGIPPTPTVTLIPAPADGDSAENPAANVALSATGTKSFQYSGDISSPEGDAEDWVKFTPYTQAVRLDLTCFDSNRVAVEILQNNTAQQSVSCGESVILTSLPGMEYTIRLSSSSTGGLQYSGYILKVTSVP